MSALDQLRGTTKTASDNNKLLEAYYERKGFEEGLEKIAANYAQIAKRVAGGVAGAGALGGAGYIGYKVVKDPEAAGRKLREVKQKIEDIRNLPKSIGAGYYPLPEDDALPGTPKELEELPQELRKSPEIVNQGKIRDPMEYVDTSPNKIDVDGGLNSRLLRYIDSISNYFTGNMDQAPEKPVKSIPTSVNKTGIKFDNIADEI